MKPGRALHELVRYLPGLYAGDLVLQILRSGIPLLPGLIVKEVLDRVSGESAVTAGFWLLLALLVGAAAARVCVLLASVATDATLAASWQGLLVRNGFRRMLARPGAQPLPYPTGDVISRLSTDTVTVTDALEYRLLAIGSFVQTALAIAVMATIDPVITAVVLVPVVAAGVLINTAAARIKRYHVAEKRAAGEVSSFLREAFDSVQAIQLASAQRWVITRFREHNEVRRRRTLQSRLFTNVFLSSVWSNTSHLGTGLVLVLAAGGFKEGTFTVGDLALFVAYLGVIADFTSMFSQSMAMRKQATASLARLTEALPDGGELTDLVRHNRNIARYPEKTASVPVDGRPALRRLEIHGLTYRHRSSGRGVAGVGLTITPGTTTIITGRVGAGKTTLLRSVLGLLPPQEGRIVWNGAEITDPATFFTPPVCAYTPQQPRLASETIRQNILLGIHVDAQQLQDAIQDAVLERDLAEFDDGLDTLAGPKGTKLSGGQLQRVAAARMFVRRPELLVFDDLSSALDVNTEKLLWQRIAERDTTCLAVSHRHVAFEQADHIVVLNEGRVEAQGTLAEVLQESAEMRELWRRDRNNGDLDSTKEVRKTE